MFAHELIAQPTNWCQNAFARNSKGERCAINAEAASQWDVTGAVLKCYNQQQDQNEIRYRLAYHLRRNELVPSNTVIGSLASASNVIKQWNDSHTTTHYEINETLQALGI